LGSTRSAPGRTQNEAEFVSTDSKLELIAPLAASGLRRIEAVSFVLPSWIPQLADGGELVAAALFFRAAGAGR
jgi:isopropylmalate/homocitrate/citramalate synthase